VGAVVIAKEDMPPAPPRKRIKVSDMVSEDLLGEATLPKPTETPQMPSSTPTAGD
ncbi:MAG: hypothetical protein GYB68_10185, partial [Chloroflexi bacterium]|nr:hypothetical protein [Chloroflexota bacterium]